MVATVKNSRMELPLPAKKHRWNTERNCWEVHHSIVEPNPNNPREKLGDDKGRLKSLMDSIQSEDHGRIHLPISGYARGNKFHVIEGHRRYFACKHIIVELKKINPEADISLYEWLPVAVESPPDELSVAIRMHTSNSLKEDWEFKYDLANSKLIFDLYQQKHPEVRIETLPEDLAHALGWSVTKFRAMVAIAQSPVLTESVNEYKSCKYKGWLHLVQVAKILKEKYRLLMEELTGVDHENDFEFDEAVYRLLVNKIRYYVGATGSNRDKVKKAQPGSLIERCTRRSVAATSRSSGCGTG